MARNITVLAPAKTNLFLAVGDVRADGYHNVTTVLCPLTLFDVLTVTETQKPLTTLICTAPTGIELAISSEDNLVLKALEAMKTAYAKTSDDQSAEPQYEITLEKQIPTGAGLGGGSSDAAAMIFALAHLWGINEHDEKLTEIAKSLGADVPFFLYGQATLMRGRGDELVRSIPMPNIDAVVIKPKQDVSTREAYKAFSWFAKDSDRDDVAAAVSVSLPALLEGIEHKNIRQIANSVYNNMEEAACALAPDITNIFKLADEVNDMLVSFVSGSGSSVVVFCENRKSAEAVHELAQHAGYWSAVVATSSIGVDIVREDVV